MDTFLFHFILWFEHHFSKHVMLIISIADLGAVGSYAKIDEDHEMSNDRGNVLKGHLLNDMKGMLTLAGLFVSFVTIVLQVHA